jgi:hypothetical protein
MGQESSDFETLVRAGRFSAKRTIVNDQMRPGAEGNFDTSQIHSIRWKRLQLDNQPLGVTTNDSSTQAWHTWGPKQGQPQCFHPGTVRYCNLPIVEKTFTTVWFSKVCQKVISPFEELRYEHDELGAPRVMGGYHEGSI